MSGLQATVTTDEKPTLELRMGEVVVFITFSDRASFKSFTGIMDECAATMREGDIRMFQWK